jgi:hypothetical protein
VQAGGGRDAVKEKGRVARGVGVDAYIYTSTYNESESGALLLAERISGKSSFVCYTEFMTAARKIS